MGHRFYSKKKIQARIATRKLVSFQLGHEKYAIAINQVHRVIHQFTPQGFLQSGRSLVESHNETITLIDISTLFLSSNDGREREYLIVCKTNREELLGLPIPQMPTILEVPEDKFGEIPEMYKKGNLSAAVTNLIHIQDGAVVFYIDLEKLSLILSQKD